MIHLRAEAKLTWYLEITGRRDDGYHELRSEMTSLELHDVLSLDPDADYVHVISPYEAPIPADGTNLVARALHLVGRHAGVTIEKAIPVGGGLGGGSADAAAILRWAGGVQSDQALTLGADVPFCQLGGRALVEGVGERLTPLPFAARDVTLVFAPFAISTAACYRAYDELWDEGWRPGGRNHLEEPAALAEPRLATTLEWLRAEWGGEVELCGSGSTMFVEGHVGDQTTMDVQSPEGLLRLYQTSTTPN
jgi:4-diphosphocytidyl-2-C-methyl-D-erythritol kinase